MTPDVNVILLDFPQSGKEMVTENEDGSFTILINAKLSYRGQLAAYHHAMKHIANDDFERDNVQAIEAVAHATKTDEIKPVPSDRFLRRLRVLRANKERIERELQRAEAEADVVRNMRGDDGWGISDSQQWFGGL